MADEYFAEGFFSKKIGFGPEIEVQTQVAIKSAKEHGDLNVLKISSVKVLFESIEAHSKEPEVIKRMICKNLIDGSIMFIKLVGKIQG